VQEVRERFHRRPSRCARLADSGFCEFDNFPPPNAIWHTNFAEQLVGISIFIPSFRTSMLHSWLALFRRLFYRALHKGRPPTPQLTSLENPEKYQSRSPRKMLQALGGDSSTLESSSSDAYTSDAGGVDGMELEQIEKQPPFERVTSVTRLPTSPGPQGANSFRHETTSRLDSMSSSCTETTMIPEEDKQPPPRPAVFGLSQVQPEASSRRPDAYIPSREAPSPPSRPSSALIALAKSPPAARLSAPATAVDRTPTLSGPTVQRTTSSKVRGRISAPLPASFVHVNGAFLDRAGDGDT